MAVRFVTLLFGVLLGLAPVQAAPTYQKNVRPLLEKYCYTCHGNGKKKAGLALDSYPDETAIQNDRKTWDKILHNVRTREMPPENKPQPSSGERELIANWIEVEVFKCDCKHPDPGRVTLRRLNRVEYANTISKAVAIAAERKSGLLPLRMTPLRMGVSTRYRDRTAPIEATSIRPNLTAQGSSSRYQ